MWALLVHNQAENPGWVLGLSACPCQPVHRGVMGSLLLEVKKICHRVRVDGVISDLREHRFCPEFSPREWSILKYVRLDSASGHGNLKKQLSLEWRLVFKWAWMERDRNCISATLGSEFGSHKSRCQSSRARSQVEEWWTSSLDQEAWQEQSLGISWNQAPNSATGFGRRRGLKMAGKEGLQGWA